MDYNILGAEVHFYTYTYTEIMYNIIKMIQKKTLSFNRASIIGRYSKIL